MDIQVGDRVTYIDKKGKKCIITVLEDKGELCDCKDNSISEIIKIERPKYEVVEEKKELLDETEREYLSNIIRPFKSIVEGIEKRKSRWDERQYIHFYIRGEVGVSFPYFKSNTMYKGMKINKEYTLSELGLEED